MSGVLISAAHKSSGKTTLSIGLSAAFTQRGYQVQTFKKGPDYIDANWLHKATQRHCFNLDFNTMSSAEIKTLYAEKSSGADASLVEANKGLYDGVHVDGRDSNAALATLLSLPVILVLDCRGVTRGIAPLVAGYEAFDDSIEIAGVMLNRVATSRHEQKLTMALQKYTDMTVLGAVYNNKDLSIDERHLGLMPHNEDSEATAKISQIATIIEEQVDVDSVLELARLAVNVDKIPTISEVVYDSDVTIGVLRDAAFGFYYADDLQALEQGGAILVEINAITDTTLPALDGLFIGGGFPEIKAQALAKNTMLKNAINASIEAGLPVYAECGGLMYLCRQISWNDKSHSMVGAIQADIEMHKKPQGRGYTVLAANDKYPWPNPKEDDLKNIAAHEFHYSSVENIGKDTVYAYKVKRGYGIDGSQDGIVYKNCLASYTHFRHTQGNHWCDRFIAKIRKVKREQGT